MENELDTVIIERFIGLRVSINGMENNRIQITMAITIVVLMTRLEPQTKTIQSLQHCLRP